jgi:hypothetical protein
MQSYSKNTIGLGILSWRAHNTLRQTLASYEQENLFSLVDESVIYFNDICDADIEIAQAADLQYAGGKNSGIFGGMQNLAQRLNSSYLLFLQNDCPLAESRESIHQQLNQAVELLENNKIDMMRLRHRWKVGEGFDLHKYLRYFGVKELHPDFDFEDTGVNKKELPDSILKKLRRFFRPSKAKKLIGKSVYLEKNPHLTHPRFIEKEGNIFIVDSSVLPFTEQSFLIGRHFMASLMDYVEQHPKQRTLNGFQSMEIALNVPYWKKGGFKIGIGTGIFTHNRFDGSFRKQHHAYKD